MNYAVIAGGESQLVSNRVDAIRCAKQLSEQRGRARVERKDGAMEMHFVHGSVSQYRFDTRR